MLISRFFKLFGLALLAGLAATGCGVGASDDDRLTVGRYETVLFETPTDSTTRPAQVLAKVDTGADLSSIDITVARELGYDLVTADTTTVVSALGTEVRPVVPIILTIGDQRLRTEATVSDRTDLSTAALIGTADLKHVTIDLSQANLTTPTGGGEAVLVGNSQLTLDGLLLLTVMPVMALLVIVFRSVIGLPTVGLFTPVLLGLAFAQARSLLLAGIFLVMLFAGFLIQPLVQRLDLTRVSRLGLLLISQVVVMKLAYQQFGSTDILDWVVAVPVIITLGMIENLWEKSRREGFRAAFDSAVWTVLLTAVTTLLLTQATLLTFMFHHPFWTTGLSTVACIALGRYHGLRATELARFYQLRAAA